MTQSDIRVRIAIFSVGILMMGVVGIASGLAEIADHFSAVSQTSIQLLITLPCIVIIFVNPLIGKLQEYICRKKLVLFGILCFLAGGVIPAFLDSFPAILVCRGILGIGVAAAQVLSTALVAEYYAGRERARVMGQLSSAQMLGCAFMFFASGYLALIGWNITFAVHGIGLISFICVAAFLPGGVPARAEKSAEEDERPQLTAAAYAWTITTLFFFISAMIFATYLAFFMADAGLGTAAQSGQATMLFAIGGFVTGLTYGKLNRRAGSVSLSVGLFLGVGAFLLVAFAPNLGVLYLGSFLYGGTVTIVFASIMMGTSLIVKPVAVPLAMSIVVMGQNLGSFLTPYIISPLASVLGANINKNAFLVGAIWFTIMGGGALVWGILKNKKMSRAQIK